MESDIPKDIPANEQPAAQVSSGEPSGPPDREQLEGVPEVSAQVVTLSGKAKVVHAQTVNVDGGQIQSLRGDTVTVTVKNGGIGAMFTSTAHVDMTNGGVGFIRASKATVKAPSVGFVMASHATIEGKVGVVLDIKAGLVAGLVSGLILAALRWVFGRRSRCR